MKNKIDLMGEIENIKNDTIELNNMIDKKCLDIYNHNNDNENKIIKYTDYMENIILEHHKICKIMFGEKK